jgi:hypothetical protein
MAFRYEVLTVFLPVSRRDAGGRFDNERAAFGAVEIDRGGAFMLHETSQGMLFVTQCCS